MPKTPARDDYFAQSFRFTPEQAATIKEEARRFGSTTAFVRELIDDYRTMFGLPRIQVEVLEADVKRWPAAGFTATRRSRPASTGISRQIIYLLAEADRLTFGVKPSPTLERPNATIRVANPAPFVPAFVPKSSRRERGTRSR